MAIDYDHARNLHTLGGATAALSTALGEFRPTSLLDVGCGTGTWLSAAADLGITELLGIDGVVLPQQDLHVSSALIREVDLSKPFSVGRRFDIGLCLEVAEHVPESSAQQLVSSIAAHTNTVLFSAACPDQPGQHHINCKWPDYWQKLFNSQGFVCDDSLRWKIWEDDRIEPWYRQNIFTARCDQENAGAEERIKPVMHPALVASICHKVSADNLAAVEAGMQPISWYLRDIPKAILTKISRKGKSIAFTKR